MGRVVKIAFASTALVCLATTAPPAPPAAPQVLLVVSRSAANPFGRYLGEILTAEGIATFDTVELSSLNNSILKFVPLVVLAEMPLSAGQASLLRDYVGGGGRLVAMRPDPQLAPALGVVDLEANGAEGYLSIDTTTPAGTGFPAATLPLAGPARHYRPVEGAASLATLYLDRGTPTSYPAVVRSGRTATWAYDLARSVVYARQGNPANAGIDRDGQPPIRSVDVFYGAIDLDRVRLPHADFQMRFFGRVIADLLADSAPPPRLWYLPGWSRTLLIPTGDSHIDDDEATRRQVASVEARGGRLTVYLSRYVEYPNADEANAWRAKGHEFGLHPYGAEDKVSLETGFRTAATWFNTAGPGRPSRTTRIHQIEWTSWVGPAQIEAKYRIGLDTTFYTWGPAVKYAGGQQAHGFISGSGLPMRFVDEAGRIIPVYQQVTSIIDEQLLVGENSERLSPVAALAVSRLLIDDSQAGGYSALVAQFHTDSYSWGEVLPWAEGTLDYAKSLGIPIWSAERWLNFTETRTATRIVGVAWSAPSLSFTATVPMDAEPQTITLPAAHAGRGLASVTVDGTAAGLVTQAITGRDTVFFSVGPGAHRITATYSAAAPPVSRPPAPALESAKVTAPEPATVPPTDSAGVARRASATEVTHTSAADFGGCGLFSGTMVTMVGDGEVRLAGAFGDDYAQGVLTPARWIAGTWSGGPLRPLPAAGVLSLASANGAFVRSAAPLNVTSLEATARFSAASWEHIGWGALDFSGPYMLFSTANTTTNLNARTSVDGKSEQRTDLGAILAGYHVYRIERTAQSPTTDVITYYIDAVQKAQHTVVSTPPLYVYQSHNGGTSPTLDIERLWVYPPYVPRGTYQGCAIDATGPVTWTAIEWKASLPADSALEVATRSSADGQSWSAWSEPVVAGGGAVSSPPGRFLQYRLSLRSASALSSPVVDSVTVTHSPIASTVQSTPVFGRR
jgi:hypothetical protein